MVKEIKLNGKHGNGKVALVDDEDYDRINKFNWNINSEYVSRKQNNKPILLHLFILNFKDDYLQVDHKNRNKLDNRKENLRICTPQQNTWNTHKKNTKIAKSKYLGVRFKNTGNKPWAATISINNKTKFIGAFKTEIEAAYHYDYFAIKYRGEFACLNFPEKDYSQFIPIESKYTSSYKYVHWCKYKEKWVADIVYQRIKRHIGAVDNEIEAAEMADYISIYLMKDKFNLNFPNKHINELKVDKIVKSMWKLIQLNNSLSYEI